MRSSDAAFDLEADLAAADPEVAALIGREAERNRSALNLIASESYCPRATLEAEASLLVTKNATGYPGSREVAGCEVFDQVETLAIDRAKRLFGAEHANIQSVAATLANIAVLRALLKPGDRILALDETAGGHHSHGARYHVSGQDYEATHFGVNEAAGGIDVAGVRSLAERVRPRILIVGSTAYPRAIPFGELAGIAREVGAYFFADIAHVVGLVVAGLHENPTPVSDVVSTSTHKTFCGPRTGGLVLCRREHAKAIDDAIFPAMQGAPGAHIIAGRAVLFGLAASEGFRELMQAVTRGAKALAASLERAGLPLYLGGTDTHMVILDLRDREVEGRAAERRLERHGLVANRVTLPEKLGARSRVGIRLGSTAMATRGMREEGFAAVGALIVDMLRAKGEHDPALERRCRELAVSFPIPAAFSGFQAMPKRSH
jgi:glycine hydroxymethyltransferase